MQGNVVVRQSGIESAKLLDAATKILAHKLVRIRGYETLIKRADDERIKALLVKVRDDEAKYSAFWSAKLQELGGRPEGRLKAYFADLRAKLLMVVLGTKGFFEWAVVGEDEGIQDLALLAAKTRDPVVSGTWTRFATDESMHLERVKSEVLGMKAWQVMGGAGVRDLILGANDGLISTLPLLAGVYAGTGNPQIVLVAGIAELFAGSISMGVGAYQSAKSEMEVLEKENRREKVQKGKTPEEQREELIKFYVAEGFKQGEAEAIVSRIAADKEATALKDSLQELGLAPEELGSPVKSAVLTGGSMAVGTLVPILPFALPISGSSALITSVAVTIALLFGVGAVKTIFSRKNWLRSGLEMMVVGVVATAATYVLGTLFSRIFDI